MRTLCFSMVILLFSFFAKAAGKDPSSICKPMLKCREQIQENDCQDYASNAETASKIRSCSTEEMSKSGWESTSDMLKACGGGVATEAVGIAKGLAAVPGRIVRSVGTESERQKKAQEYCTKFLDLPEAPYYDDPMSPKQSTKDWNSCVARVSSEGKEINIPSAAKIGQSLKKLVKTSSCFKWDSKVRIICPVVASVLAGAAEGYLVKRAIVFYANRAAIEGTKTALEVKQTAEDLNKMAKLKKETLSVSHTMDLVLSTESYGGKKVFANLGMDLRQTQMAMLQSDAGKMAEAWSKSILMSNSDEMLTVLNGQSTSPAATALKEVLREGGLKPGKTLLPGDLKPDQIRAVLDQNPSLKTGYLHELPGVADAVADLNAKKITVEQFKTRVAANLFHNGPDDGFWKFYGHEILPKMLGKSEDGATKNFFKSTVFEGPTDASGVVVPNYPSPISKEGVFHTIVDRLSQATIGGRTKIFQELGARSGKQGLNDLNELLTLNGKNTLLQYDHLTSDIAKMGKLTARERETLTSLTKDAMDRLEKQQKFYTVNYTDKGMDIQYKQFGFQKTIHLNPDASSEKIYEALNDVLKAEEKANGEPLSTFIKTSFGPAVGRPAALGLADLPLVCQAQDKATTSKSGTPSKSERVDFNW